MIRYVDSLDLAERNDQAQATRSSVGRDAIDPRVLFSLWLFATLEGENNARRIARLTERDLAYMWICVGVLLHYHALCSFHEATRWRPQLL